jgi:hypothetical protein
MRESYAAEPAGVHKEPTRARTSVCPALNQVGRARCCTRKAAARPTTSLSFREVVVAGQLEAYPDG